MGNGAFYSPSLALFGYGCRENLVELLKERRYKKALLVTDKGICDFGIADKITAVLEKAGVAYAMYNGVQPNPTVDNVHEGYRLYQQEGCDFVVTLGGGSPQDCGKGIALLAVNGGDILTYLRDGKKTNGAADIIAITTTAGTGSECTRAYVITDEATTTKYGRRDNSTQAKIAVNDWELMMKLPKGLTTATGMDALTHAVESLIGKSSFLLSERLALSAIQLIFDYLPMAAENPESEEAREAMSTAQYMAGLAFGNSGVGLVHSMSHQLSAVYHLPHGLSNAILLPYVLEYEKPACQKQLAKIAQAVRPLESEGKTVEELAEMAIEAIFALSAQVGTKVPLTELGVKQEDITLLAEKTMEDSSLGNSPVVPNVPDIKAIFEKAM